MERKRMIQKLESMKKELAKKQRKFEIANRAARVKAHVKQKIQELNLQASKEKDCYKAVHSVSPNTGAVFSRCALPSSLQLHCTEDVSAQKDSVLSGTDFPHDRQSCPLEYQPENEEGLGSSGTHFRRCTSQSDMIVHASTEGMKCSFSEERNTVVNSVIFKDLPLADKNGVVTSEDTLAYRKNNVMTNSQIETPTAWKHHSSLKLKQEHDLQKVLEKEFMTISSPDKGCTSAQVTTGQDENLSPCILDIDDSLAITPTFRSLKDTNADLSDSSLLKFHSAVEGFTNIASGVDNFTLNLDTEESSPDPPQGENFTSNAVSVTHKTESQDQTDGLPPISSQKHDDSNVELEYLSDMQPDRCPAKHEYLANAALQNADRSPEPEPERCRDLKMVSSKAHSERKSSSQCTKTVALPDPVSKPRKGRTELRLQDIGSAKDTMSQDNSQHPATLPDRSNPPHDQFLEYTELDVIPYSQFELTEDFLSEPSQTVRNSNRPLRKSAPALIQRRSPRLSSFDFVHCDQLASDTRHSQLACQQSNLFKMSRKQKKTKTALLLSSLFQYLIDEAKRDATFVEFKLPSDLVQLVTSVKDGATEMLSGSGKKTPLASGDCCGSETQSQDIESVPETEIDPDIASQSTGAGHSGQEIEDCEAANEEIHQNKTPCEMKASTKEDARRNSKGKREVALHGKAHVSAVASSISRISSLVSPKNPVCSDEPDSEERSLKEGRAWSDPENQMQSIPVPAKLITNGRKATGRKSLKLKSKLSRDDTSENKCSQGTVSSHSITAGKGRDLTDTRTCLTEAVMSPKRLTLSNLPSPSPNVCQQHMQVIASSSTVLIRTGLNSPAGTKLGEQIGTAPGSRDQCAGESKGKRLKPVFTPSKTECRLARKETDSSFQLKFAGCAESGCKDAVVDTVVGTTATDSEETAFVLSLQTTALTLWTLENQQQQWSSEFHWYLPQTSAAEGMCRIYSHEEKLAVLVWGKDLESLSVVLIVFVYRWDTQHTQRFNLPLPSAVAPQRMFCHGLQSSSETVLVFTTDSAYTRGVKYVMDSSDNKVRMQQAMEEASAQLADLRPVEQCPDAVLGLSVDQRIFIWNHTNGALIFTLQLPGSLPLFGRMFTCYSLKGYFLLHMVESEGNKDLCLVALNPVAATGKVIKRFTLPTGQHINWCRCVVHQSVLLSVSQEGTVSLWDACRAKPLLSCYCSHDQIQVANIFGVKDSAILLTGQRNGCLHLYWV